jgi:molybdenum cofactor guanylyltransferase
MSGGVEQQRAVCGYVLAGGASLRFGRDKAEAELGGVPMLARMTALILSVTGLVSIVGSQKKYGGSSAEVIEDRWPGEGPLGGIVTALQSTELRNKTQGATLQEWNLIVSCDMPFLTAEWLAFMCERACKSDAQVVLAYSAHGPEPLCACWRTDAMPILQDAFQSGVRRVNEGIARLRAEVLDARDWKRFDNAGRLFWNMNTQAHYEEARRILEKERG